MSQREPAPHSDSPPIDERCEQAMQLQIAGRLDLAEPMYRSILAAQPAHAAANYCLGMMLVQLRRPAEGLPHLLRALNANAQIADYWLGYLEALLILGEGTAARDALALARRHGLAGKAADDFESRLGAHLERAAGKAMPSAPEGMAAASPTLRASRRREAQAIRRQEAAVLDLIRGQRFTAALPLARDMTERFPEYGVGWKILGAMLWAAEPSEDALAAMLASVRLLPRDAEAHANLGTALNKLRRLDQAERWLRHALQIDPNSAAAHSQLADNLQLQGRHAEAEASFRRAIALAPSDFAAGADTPESGLLFTMNHNPTVSAAALFEEHCRVGERLERAVRQGERRHASREPRPAHDARPERRLEVGLVSADLRNHAVASFVEPLLREWQGHDNLRVTVYYTHPTGDDVTARLQGYVARWFPVFALSNRQLAHKIEDDGIDILIDLAGHTAMHRLGAFAHKPAPIQASWLGYPATTGLRSVDYYLTDRHFLPAGQFERHFTEKLVYLPAAWSFQPCAAAPPVSPLPALASGAVTFGSFNRLGKINEATVRLWSQLLRALPTARMLLAGVPLERQHHQLIDWFATAGIDRGRLTFHPWSNQEAHLALHHQVDIGLETMPYTGCTTSNHALWMGVPTLTLAGTTPASRLSAANLGHLGLEEFIADSADEFAAKGLRWARDLPALATLRAELRARWQRAPARQAGFVAAGMELALRRMWRQWCAGLPPESFEISVPRTADGSGA